MPSEIAMPQLSDTMSEGTVVKWIKKEGDKVKEGEKIAEIETDKAVMEMECFEGGTLAAILIQEGEKVPVGGTIAVLALGNENAADVKKQYSGGKPSASASNTSADEKKAVAESVSAEVAVDARKPAALATETSVTREQVQQSAAVAALESASRGEMREPDDVGHGATREKSTAVPPVPAHVAAGDNGHGPSFVSPLARRIAADLNVDLSQIQGSGPNGRIIQRDVMQWAGGNSGKVAAPLAAVPAKSPVGTSGHSRPTTGNDALPPSAPLPIPARLSQGDKQVLPMSKMRLAIAKGLQSSKQTIPHFYITVQVDVEALSELRQRLNTMLEAEKIRLSIGDLISKAVAVALQRHPALNAHYSEAKAEVTRFADVHLGFAVALPEGLIVPVLRSIDQMGLKEIRQRSSDLIDRARAQKLKQDEMTGATFTVSNLGTFGVREFSAIINPPSVAILAVAAAEKRAVVRNDQVVARSMMNLTLSADHRVVDGATAAEFMRTLKGLLEEPGLMLI